MASTNICPICKNEFETKRAQNKGHFPFCSERCKLVDLGKWLDGQYAIPAEDTTDNNKTDSPGDL